MWDLPNIFIIGIIAQLPLILVCFSTLHFKCGSVHPQTKLAKLT